MPLSASYVIQRSELTLYTPNYLEYGLKNFYPNLSKNLILNFSVTVRTLGEMRMALGSPCEALQDVHIRFALKPKKNWELSTNSNAKPNTIPFDTFSLLYPTP